MGLTHDHSRAVSGITQYSRDVRRILIFVLGMNWLVAVLKLIFGYKIASASMVADGYHSFADGASNIIGIIGIVIACQPKDKGHPYGHKKYETFASTLIAFLLFLVCFFVLHNGFERLCARQIPQISLLSFCVMLAVIAVNIIVMVYEYRKGKELGSDILVTDSLHTRADILTSFSVLAAFAGVKLGFPVLDAMVAVIIAVLIGFSAVKILKNTSTVLCDTAVMDSADIEGTVLRIAGVRKCHQIRTRGRQDDIHIDLHVLVDDRMPLVDAHALSSRIENVIKENFKGVTDVVVHMEPLSSEKDGHA